MIKIFVVIIGILVFSNAYFINQCYVKLEEVNYLKSMTLQRDVEYMSRLLDNPRNFETMLNASVSVYFKFIGKGQHKLLKHLNKESIICSAWTTKTKEQYFNVFSKYLSTAPNELIEDFKLTFRGLEIVDAICLKNTMSHDKNTTQRHQ